MSCKSALYAANVSSQTLAAGNVISFGQIIRRFGANTKLEGGNLALEGQGYYDIDSNFTVQATAAGAVTITFYKDGVEIPGAKATQTMAANSLYQLTVPFIVRKNCCCESVITAVVSAGATVSNATISAEKI